jgi:Flp pilus assembly pilin Flp
MRKHAPRLSQILAENSVLLWVSSDFSAPLCYNSGGDYVKKYANMLRRFPRANEGVSAIEFAVVAPVLLLLIFGIVEFAMIMLVANIMENATSISSRLGKTGYSASGQSRADTIRASVIARAGGLVDADQLVITSKFYKQFDQINNAEPWNDSNGNGLAEVGEYTDINGNGQYDTDMGLAGYGNAEDIVVYTISYPWGIMTPIMREIIGNAQGQFPIIARAVVKNEPYDD